MFKTTILFSVILCLAGPAQALTPERVSACIKKLKAGENRLSEKLPEAPLKKLAEGFKKYKGQLQEEPVALLVDYSKNSKEKRSYLIDFDRCDIISEEYVAHGGYYREGGKTFYDGDPNNDGMLDKCKNRQGNRKNMTRPGLYVTGGCHETKMANWTFVNGECEGVKLHGLENTNNDAFNKGVVLHEHKYMKNDTSIKAIGQGCPTFAPGKLKAMMRYGLFDKTLVVLHAPQCRGGLFN